MSNDTTLAGWQRTATKLGLRVKELEAREREVVKALRSYKRASGNFGYGKRYSPVIPPRSVHDAFIEFIAKIDKENDDV